MLRRLVEFAAVTAMAVLTAGTPAAAQSTNRVAAVVGDDLITAMDVDESISGMGPNVKEKAGERIGEIKKVALERLIEEKLFEQEVKRLNIRVSNQETQAYIDRIKSANQVSEAEFAARLSRRGLTPEEYRKKLQHDILKHKLIRRQVGSRVVVSEEQVEEYYQENTDQFQNLDNVRLRALFLNLPYNASPALRETLIAKANKLRAEAVAQQNMAELCREHSQGPGADDGGKLGPLATKDLLPEMRLALGGLETNQISEVMSIPTGLVFIQLLQRQGATTTPLAEVREAIKKKLHTQGTEKIFREFMKELRSKTYVEIISP